MLTIRAEQMQAFADAALDAEKAHLRALLAHYWPDLAARRDGGWPFVELVVEQTRRYGIDDPADMAAYLNVMAALGPAFEDDVRFPWARPILENDSLRPSARLQYLRAEVAHCLAAQEGTEP